VLDDAVRASKEIMWRHHDGPITAVALSADGALLATASFSDNTARLFEAARSWRGWCTNGDFDRADPDQPAADVFASGRASPSLGP
jgi:hypothetical protein